MTELQAGQITIGDLYRELVGMRQDISKALVRIEVIDSRNAGADQVHDDHERRLRALETFRWKLTGTAVVAGLFSGSGGAVIGYLLARH